MKLILRYILSFKQNAVCVLFHLYNYYVSVEIKSRQKNISCFFVLFLGCSVAVLLGDVWLLHGCRRCGKSTPTPPQSAGR